MQRKVRQWRALAGPDQEVFFPQEHRPGEAFQTDFTWCNQLQVTLGGEPFEHMLCHVVLPYSNWEWACVCLSESMAALKKGLQEALFRLGKVPRFNQTDHSSAATHRLGEGHHAFNEAYLALLEHFGLEPRLTEVGEKEQNGDVESSHRGLKARLEQQLMLRGSRDFATREAYEVFVREQVEARNQGRTERLKEELTHMTPLTARPLPLFTSLEVPVGQGSTVRVKHNSYSVPSRLKGQRVEVRLYEDMVEILHGGQLQVRTPRLLGRFGHRIDYRHVIWSLVRKPGAFARYKYREALFPTERFRHAYDQLSVAYAEPRADLEYLRLLHLAASTMESEVEAALSLLAEAGQVPTLSRTRALLEASRGEVPELAPIQVSLSDYDALLVGREVAR